MAQYAVPDADITDASWQDQSGGTTLFSAINNGINGPGASPNDSTYITDQNFFPSPCEVSLGSLSTPSSRTNHYIYIRVRRTDGFTNNVTIQLKEGSNVRWTETLTSVTASFQTLTSTLDSTAMNSITDYSNLSVTLGAGNAPDVTRISEVEFEVPDAGGGGGGEPPKLNPEFFIMCL